MKQYGNIAIYPLILNNQTLAEKQKYSTISINEKMYRECGAMLSHALGSGYRIPPNIVVNYEKLEQKNLTPLKTRHRDFLSDSKCDFKPHEVGELAKIHAQLTSIVAPAKPYTLLLLQTDAQNNKWQRFGSVPLMRRMLRVGIFSMIALVVFALFPQVSANTSESLFTNKGFSLILNLGFLLSAAAMGAAFHAIFKARDYVSNYTFDPSYESTYWAEFVLGLIAGVLLGGVFSEDVSSETGMHVGKVTLALIGGFSSTAVYEILNRMVGAITYIVKPEGKKLIEAEIKSAKASVKEELVERKKILADHLNALQSDIFSGKFSKDEIGGRVQGLLKNLVSGDIDAPPTPKTTTESTVPTTTTPTDRPPIEVPPTNEPVMGAESIDPNTVEHYHEDYANDADDEEYIDRV